ncbi:MAG: stage 0 sporulation family protein [Clostridiales bacterium]|nr:stage 0 sporulation family protein [Clostridiales bacterium]
MVTIVGVRFKKAGKIYYFNPGDLDIKKNDCVIVETARGVELGEVVIGPKEVPEEDIVAPLKDVIRIMTEEDRAQHLENKEKEKEAFEICLKKIEEHGLDMKLIDAEYTFDNNKVIFYFTADGRIDFRELVKDLAAIFRTRIELRQIGVRDEAKMLDGIGTCGRRLCCSTWLGDFEPVSIKMAKEQSLSLNPSKISGICGRLFCCLKFEHDVYQEVLDKLPGTGSLVETPYGEGRVIEINVLLEQVKVKVRNELDNTDEVFICIMNEITKIKEKSSLKEQLESDDNLEEGLLEEELRELMGLQEEE